jgi:hypothetical protein
MDRAMLLENLGQARARVIGVERDIACQKQLIGELIRGGQGDRATGACEFLHALEIAQALCVTHHDYLEKELANSDSVQLVTRSVSARN